VSNYRHRDRGGLEMASRIRLFELSANSSRSSVISSTPRRGVERLNRVSWVVWWIKGERHGKSDCPTRHHTDFFMKKHTLVDVIVGERVNYRLPVAKGERGQLREHRGTLPQGLSSDSKEC